MNDRDSHEGISRSAQSPASDDRPTRTMADLLFLPETERGLMNWLLRQKSASLAEVAAQLMQDEAIAQTALDELIAQGFVRSVEINSQMQYQPCLTSRRGRQVSTNIWNALDS